MGNRTTFLKSAAFVGAGYLYGSVPFVYYLGRARGVDLRKAGSGTVGGSNLWQQAGPAAGAVGWLLDASKGALPALVGPRLGLPSSACAAGAAAGVIGQCWPAFLGLDGGRGVSAILGASAALAPEETAAMLVPMVGGSSVRAVPLLVRSKGKRLKDLTRLQGENSKAVPLSVGLSIVGIPLLAALRGRPREVVLACSANAALLFIRRLTADLEELRRSKAPIPMMLNRLLYDRNYSKTARSEPVARKRPGTKS